MLQIKKIKYLLLSHILFGQKKEHYRNKYKKLKKESDPLEHFYDRLKEINDKIDKLDQIIGIANTNTWYLTHVNRNICNIFQYMTGIELNKNFVMEREIVFDPKNAPIDHYNRYCFAVENVRDSDYVADIACACGYGSSMLAAKAKKVIGVDIFRPVVDFANKIFASDNCSFICQDAQSLHLQEELDTVVSFETIEHIPEPDKFLNAVHKILKKDGKIICSVPNETTRPYIKEGNSFHYRHYTREQFEQLLSECGFEIVTYCQQYQDNNYTVEQRPEEGQIIVVVAVKKE